MGGIWEISVPSTVNLKLLEKLSLLFKSKFLYCQKIIIKISLIVYFFVYKLFVLYLFKLGIFPLLIYVPSSLYIKDINCLLLIISYL